MTSVGRDSSSALDGPVGFESSGGNSSTFACNRVDMEERRGGRISYICTLIP